MSSIRVMMVGTRFRQGGMAVLEHLSRGTGLRLKAEPENAYDAGAIRCEVDLGSVPMEMRESLNQRLSDFGMLWEDLKNASIIEYTSNGEDQHPTFWYHIGYVDAKNGGTRTLRVHRPDIDQGPIEARLEFDGSGKPWVEVEK